MKKVIALFVVIALCLSFGTITAFALEPTVANIFVKNSTTSDSEVSPRIIHRYTKTVTNFYSDYAAAPSSISYKEYTMYAWFSGTLYLQKIVRSDNVWSAIYSGTLVGNI